MRGWQAKAPTSHDESGQVHAIESFSFVRPVLRSNSPSTALPCPASWLEIQARLTPPHQHMRAKVHLEINSSETVEDEDDGPVFLV